MWLQRCLSQWNSKGRAGEGGMAGTVEGVHLKQILLLHLTKCRDKHRVINELLLDLKLEVDDKNLLTSTGQHIMGILSGHL